MESNTQTGELFDIGSLYAHFQGLSDLRQRRGRRYSLALILLLIVLAKLCGENHPSGIAEWAAHRAAKLVELLRLQHKRMPHHSTYRRILAEVVSVSELEQMSRAYLGQKQRLSKQILVAIDGKVLRGTLDEQQNGVYLLAAYLPNEGLVLMEVALESRGGEITAAPQVLKSLDLRGKVVMATLCILKELFLCRSWSLGANTSGSLRAISPKWKETFACGSNPMFSQSLA